MLLGDVPELELVVEGASQQEEAIGGELDKGDGRVLLVDHRGRLLTLKVNLETLRRKLVSPLVRRNDSVSFIGVDGSSAAGNSGAAGRMHGPVESVIDGQIRGLEGTYDYLRSVRERQKAKLMEMVYGSGRKPSQSMFGGIEGDDIGIEGA